jgi:hypothetical protein
MSVLNYYLPLYTQAGRVERQALVEQAFAQLCALKGNWSSRSVRVWFNNHEHMAGVFPQPAQPPRVAQMAFPAAFGDPRLQSFPQGPAKKPKKAPPQQIPPMQLGFSQFPGQYPGFPQQFPAQFQPQFQQQQPPPPPQKKRGKPTATVHPFQPQMTPQMQPQLQPQMQPQQQPQQQQQIALFPGFQDRMFPPLQGFQMPQQPGQGQGPPPKKGRGRANGPV